MLAALAAAQTPTGIYLGELNVMTRTVRLGLEVKAAGANKYTSELTSLDQGYAKMPATSTDWDGKVLKFAIGAANASFEGSFSEDGNTLSGKFTQGLALDLTFKRVAALPKPARPQEPQGTPSYTVEEVTFAGGAPDGRLAGTLTAPKAGARLGAVVLVTGSGPQNRDEELAAHKPFWIWADALTKAGFAVLRYDDRGVAKSTGSFKGSTTMDFALDAKAAVAYVRTRKEIDPAKIVVLGHSEGGLVAPMVAIDDTKLAGIVLLAGPGVSGGEILKKQLPDLMKAAGAPESMADAQLARMQQQRETDPWMKYFWDHDPAEELKKVKCPVLALNGELDLQVNAAINLGAIEAALKAGGNTKYVVKTLPKLNHLMQTAKTGAPAEYGQIEETASPVALSEVTNWLKQTLTTK